MCIRGRKTSPTHTFVVQEPVTYLSGCCILCVIQKKGLHFGRERSKHCAADAVLTCEVAQAQLAQAVVAVPPVVEEDGQRVAAVVQLGAADDPEVLQRQIVELVEGHQHVAGHFSDGLRGEKEDGVVTLKQRGEHYSLLLEPCVTPRTQLRHWCVPRYLCEGLFAFGNVKVKKTLETLSKMIQMSA